MANLNVISSAAVTGNPQSTADIPPEARVLPSIAPPLLQFCIPGLQLLKIRTNHFIRL